MEPEIREVERIVREQIEHPPAECLTPPPVIEPMPDGYDWRQRAGDMTEIAQINERIAEACQGWWARVEADREGQAPPQSGD